MATHSFSPIKLARRNAPRVLFVSRRNAPHPYKRCLNHTFIPIKLTSVLKRARYFFLFLKHTRTRLNLRFIITITYVFLRYYMTTSSNVCMIVIKNAQKRAFTMHVKGCKRTCVKTRQNAIKQLVAFLHAR